MTDMPGFEKREDKIGPYIYCVDGETVSFESMCGAVSYLEEDTTLPRELRILEIALDTRATFNIHDVKVLYQKMKEAALKYTFIKHAVVHNSKKNTAYALFVETLTRHARYELRVFSSVKAAEKWLLITDSSNQ